MLVKKTSKNQLTLPRDIANAFGDVEYFDASRVDDRIVLIPVQVVGRGDTLSKVREKAIGLGLTENDVTEAVSWARRERH